MRLFVILLLLISTGVSGSPLDDLRREHPRLASLLSRYKSYQNGLEKYARQQGFKEPYEQLAVVVHEVVHIDSAVHQGYYIDGIYYEPYINKEHWPSLRNRDIAPLMMAGKGDLIRSVYMQATPANGLGNILDEVNAYTHVLGFVCKHEPRSASRQVENLSGHLYVVEAYLRVARISVPGDYMALLSNRLSAGALYTITQRAWGALLACGVPEAQIPRQEAVNFIGSMQRSR